METTFFIDFSPPFYFYFSETENYLLSTPLYNFFAKILVIISNLIIINTIKLRKLFFLQILQLQKCRKENIYEISVKCKNFWEEEEEGEES